MERAVRREGVEQMRFFFVFGSANTVAPYSRTEILQKPKALRFIAINEQCDRQGRQYDRQLGIRQKRWADYHSENKIFEVLQMTVNPHKWRDVAWKKAIIDGAQDAIAYFMPDLASNMDASREVIGIIGMELPVKDSDSDKDMRISDVLLNVPVKGGEDWSVACLVEQQDAYDNCFAARMFDSVVRLRASRPAGRVTGFAIYTGDSKDVNLYTETCYGLELSLKFRSFHVPSYTVEELRSDNRPFAQVMYAGRMSYESGNDLALRAKFAQELLNKTDNMNYDNIQRKYILEFSERIFRLKDPKMSDELREAYNMKTVSLKELSNQLSKEEGIMIGEERGIKIGEERGEDRGMKKTKLEVARKMLARKMSVNDIADITGLNEQDILSIQ
jgi:hypothetical protein